MRTLSPPGDAALRTALTDRYTRNRERSERLFALIDPAAYYERPIPLRHPFAFYEGHIPNFSFLTFNRRALHEDAIDNTYERLFERGIDPADAATAQQHQRTDWPAQESIEAYARACDERVLAAFASACIVDDDNPSLRGLQAPFTILEHEEMHQETLMYIVHQLPPELKGRVAQEHHDTAAPVNDFVQVPAGTATLGMQRGEAFGWDNEFDAFESAVGAFSVQRYPVSNGEYLQFVDAGGPRPHFWIEEDGEFLLRAAFETLPLPRSWPAYVTHAQAQAYASWRGHRLMTEAEYHRAAYSSAGGERPYPWGTQAPEPMHGNFDFERFDPEPVDAHPAGASAWGVYDLVGNGWEWTATEFAPFDGFEPMASYPRYSADFFDGKHYVMKGASPVTPRELVRRSFRNWFYGGYPYMYAKFRCVAGTG